MVGGSLPLAEHWMGISLSNSKHWEGCGVGVNFSFSETQVKAQHTSHTDDSKLTQIMFRHIWEKCVNRHDEHTDLMSVKAEIYQRLRSWHVTPFMRSDKN